ncbi:NAD-dependent epimerase/dehydratase family protein [Kiloniella sp.]|uniref:NAD-dependent epimerase/dehydratase family protein n=1 Tax=Kiloniella sp. TaxID=1938587 RepID=UPI003B02AFB1
MKVIVFGGTGMVGSEVLQLCLGAPEISQVVTIGRHLTGLTHPKLTEVGHQDFTNFTVVEKVLADADICYYCVGVYQGQVSKELFWQVTVGYLEALLASLEKVNPNIRFCLFSGRSASPSERLPGMYPRAKGRAEVKLNASSLKGKYIFRPGIIAPGKVASKKTISTRLFEPIYKMLPFLGIDAPDLAKVMVWTGLAGGADKVLENGKMRKLSRLPLSNFLQQVRSQ